MKNAFIHYVQDYACPNTGAIVGYNYGTITNSYVNGNVKSGNGRTYTCNSVAGAITGYNRGTITKSYSKGAVFSNSSNQGVAGGITGYNRDGGTISNSYSNVNVRGHGGDDGGLIGGIIGSHYTGSAITNCYATGSQALGNGGTGAGLIGSYGSAPLPTRSYAINNSYRAIGNADSNTTHYCSMSRDAGCSATAINSNWSSTIWSGLGTNNPTLKNMPN